jgi:hypothetical protein
MESSNDMSPPEDPPTPQNPLVAELLFHKIVRNEDDAVAYAKTLQVSFD